MSLNNPFGEVIYSYSRAQAVADGVLVDLSQFKIVRDHWKLNLCCTDRVWTIIKDAVNQHKKDYDGILHDLSTCAKAKIGPGGDTLVFACIVGKKTHGFKLHCGPGDTAAPVLTLMLPNES